jgi:DNA-binding CsgD family transcriptional regulator
MSDLPDDATVHRNDQDIVRIWQIPDEESLSGSYYELEAPLYRGDVRFEDPELAELYADVYWCADMFSENETGERGVPPRVARRGQEAIVAYCIARSPGTSVEWAAAEFDVSEDTVRTYLSRVRRQAEVQREAYEEAESVHTASGSHRQ